jgi:environmental stress-induced protein Ves
MVDQFFSRDTIPATAWKNGGGVTREILRSPEGMPYRRFSIADVGREGPFSKFEGLPEEPYGNPGTRYGSFGK